MNLQVKKYDAMQRSMLTEEKNQKYQQIVRNKRISTEVLGSSLESTKVSRGDGSGYQRMTTHIVRKVCTLSRVQEQPTLPAIQSHSSMKKATYAKVPLKGPGDERITFSLDRSEASNEPLPDKGHISLVASNEEYLINYSTTATMKLRIAPLPITSLEKRTPRTTGSHSTCFFNFEDQ